MLNIASSRRLRRSFEPQRHARRVRKINIPTSIIPDTIAHCSHSLFWVGMPVLPKRYCYPLSPPSTMSTAAIPECSERLPGCRDVRPTETTEMPTAEGARRGVRSGCPPLVPEGSKRHLAGFQGELRYHLRPSYSSGVRL